MKQSNKKKKFKGVAFMLVIMLIYLVLYFSQASQIIDSLTHLFKNLLLIIPIFGIVILLTAAISYYFPKEKILAMLKGNSKYKTYLYSLIAGIISHGPIFAWYPLLENLKEKGVSKGTLVTFIYGRSIKLTLLPVMLGFFGKIYVIVFIFFLAIGAFIQGILYDKLDSKH